MLGARIITTYRIINLINVLNFHLIPFMSPPLRSDKIWKTSETRSQTKHLTQIKFHWIAYRQTRFVVCMSRVVKIKWTNSVLLGWAVGTQVSRRHHRVWQISWPAPRLLSFMLHNNKQAAAFLFYHCRTDPSPTSILTKQTIKRTSGIEDVWQFMDLSTHHVLTLISKKKHHWHLFIYDKSDFVLLPFRSPTTPLVQWIYCTKGRHSSHHRYRIE